MYSDNNLSLSYSYLIQDKISGKIVFCRVFCPPNESLLDGRSLAGCCKPGSNVAGCSASPGSGCFCKKYRNLRKITVWGIKIKSISRLIVH